jgi:hypothetical protein
MPETTEASPTDATGIPTSDLPIPSVQQETTVPDVILTGQPTTEGMATVEPTISFPDITVRPSTIADITEALPTTEQPIPSFGGETNEPPVTALPTTEQPIPSFGGETNEPAIATTMFEFPTQQSDFPTVMLVSTEGIPTTAPDIGEFTGATNEPIPTIPPSVAPLTTEPPQTEPPRPSTEYPITYVGTTEHPIIVETTQQSLSPSPALPDWETTQQSPTAEPSTTWKPTGRLTFV